MNFQELGLTLQREREKKGLSISVVMEATKISRTNIVAIENGDRSFLPHPVYVKGFVKSYARYLGLDGDELSMIIDREYQDETDGPEEQAYEVSPAAEKAFHDNTAPEIKKRSVWPMLLGVVFLIIIGILLIVNLNGNDSDEPVEPAVSTEQSEEAIAPEPIQSESADEKVADTQVSDAAESDDSSVAPEKKADTTQATKPEEPAKPEVKPAPKVEKKLEAKKTVEVTKPEKQKYDHVLIIRATSDKGCWIGLWKGDEANMARDFVLKQGEPLRLMFNSPRRIRIGNVAGVSVLYNGKPYRLNNAKGNIQTLRFGTE